MASSNAAGSQYEGFLSHGGSPIAGLQLFTMENSMEIGDLGVPQLIGNLNNVLPSGNLT